MTKRIIIAIIILVALIPLYMFYCDYVWDKFYQQHQWWGREELIDTYNFDLNSEPHVVTSDNFIDYTWKRILVEPDHALWINEVVLSFPNDTTISVKVDPHYFDDNWWTYPITRRFKYDRKAYVDTYYFNKDKMIFVREFEPYQDGDSLYSTPPDTVHLALNDDKLSIKHVFL